MVGGNMYTPWELREFTGGLIEKLHDNIIPDNAGRDMSNFVSSRLGGLQVRSGQRALPNSTITLGTGDIVNGMGILFRDDSALDPPKTSESIIVAANKRFYTYTPNVGMELHATNPNFNENYPVHFIPGVNELVAYQSNYDTSNYETGFKIDHSAGTITTLNKEGHLPTLHKESLFLADGEMIIWSAPFDFTDWPGTNYWMMTMDSEHYVTAMKVFKDGLAIFKENAFFLLKGDSLDDFMMLNVDLETGCSGHNAVAVLGETIYFVSHKGLYSSDGWATENISEPVIPDLWSELNREYLYWSKIQVYNGQLWISVPHGDSTVNNMTIIFDPTMKTFWPTNIHIMDGKLINLNHHKDVVESYRSLTYITLDNVNGQLVEQDRGHDDLVQPISAYWKGKYFDMGRPEVEKKGRKLFLQHSPDTEEEVDLSISLDYGDYIELDHNRKENYTAEFHFPIDNNRFRYLSPKVEYEGTSECEVRGISIPFKPKRTMGVREGE